MSLITKLAALVEALRGADFNAMRPAERRQLAAVCRFIADKAEPKPESCEPKGEPMPIALAEKIVALFNVLTLSDIDAMPPVERERFRLLCGYWAEKAKPRPAAGVLLHLRTHRRDE